MTETPTPVRRWLPRAHPISWWMLLVSSLAILITSIDRAILPTVLPGIIDEFGLTKTEAGLLVSLSFVGTFVGAILLGVLGDVFGRGHHRARTWVVTVLVTCVASIATAYARGIDALRAWRVVMGIGTGGMEPVNVALIGEWWQKEDRGFAVGVHHTGFPIGQLLGPVLIGWVLVAGTWRDAFLWLPLIAVPIMIAQLKLGTRDNLAKVNAWIERNRLTPAVPADEERRFTNPFRAVRDALVHRNVQCGVGLAFCLLWAETGVTAFLTVQLTEHADFSLAGAAVVSGASGITGWIGQVVWGTLSDHLGRKFSLSIICVGWTATVLAMIFISGPVSAWLVLLAWGIFRNSPFPVAYALVVDSTPRAASSGMGLVIGLALGVSGAIVPAVSGWIIDHHGFTWDYLMLAAACLVALVPVALMRETVTRR
ncbi:MFS transporter [Pseudonocardia eucalypti]|uniref:MFS transporter n=1 Tax=Pseudonocardia eucalypti TaxID=648755 RepID=A0ABP9RCW8_9PSEU|nr:MFS family permease [Pseudonocardia eucalypti]